MSPFLIIYDQQGEAVAGSGYLAGQVPKVPIGVLNASNKKIHTVTWQPREDVRIASVTEKSGNFYVLGGRSLKQTEDVFGKISLWFLGGWLLT